MSAYRKRLIIGLNLLVFIWLLKAMLLDQNSDVVGLFVLAGLLVMAIFTTYALSPDIFFFKRRREIRIELLFSGLLLAPWFVSWWLYWPSSK